MMPTLCPNCASEIPEGASSCAHCASVDTVSAPESVLPVPAFAAFEDLEGLSGWLFLVGIGLVASPFLLIRTILTVNIPFLYGEKYQIFLAAHPTSMILGVFELITNLILITFVLALNYLFYRKKNAFPTYMIIYLIAQICLLTADHLTVRALHPTLNLAHGYANIARLIVSSCIWIPYFLVSRRVKATFVR